MKIRTFIASGLIVGGMVSGSRAEQKVLAQVEIRGLDRVAADVARLTETAGQPRVVLDDEQVHRSNARPRS